jgi:hypothetical protein
MTIKDGKFNTQVHIWIAPETINKLDQLVEHDPFGSNRSRIVRELIEKAFDKEFTTEGKE